MKRVFNILHWLNIDTALGVVITSEFVANTMDNTVPFTVHLALFITVLAIYNFDHLLDAYRIKFLAQSLRRSFYQHHFNALTVYEIVLLMSTLLLVWYLPSSIIRAGIILGLASVIYFLLLFILFPKRFILKEIIISVVFTSAIFIGPFFAHSPQQFAVVDALLGAEILLLAISNTYIFAWFDYSIDLDEGHTSIATTIGKNPLHKIIIGLFLIQGVLIVIQLYVFHSFADQAIIGLMTGLLALIFTAARLFARNDFYRIAGDAAFMLPLFALFL